MEWVAFLSPLWAIPSTLEPLASGWESLSTRIWKAAQFIWPSLDVSRTVLS